MSAFKANEYNTGGVVPPRHSSEMEDATKCSIPTASMTTAANNPNINNVDPGSHHEKGAGVAQANKP